MPRQSSDARHYKVRSSAERLRPPAELTASEKQIFIHIVSTNKPEHFAPSDLPILVAYVHACALESVLARKLAAENTTKRKPPADHDYKILLRWERVCRVMTALCQRLRLSPQSRTPTHSAPRSSPTLEQQQQSMPSNYYDQMKLQNGDDDDDHERAH
jgi:hypothetical protein